MAGKKKKKTTYCLKEKTSTSSDRYAEGRSERLPDLAEELVRFKVDILVGTDSSQPERPRRRPQLFPSSLQPAQILLHTGLVASLARPGGNVTGVTTNSPELVGKRLELLKEAVPKVSRIAFLMPADSATIRAMFDDAQGAAKALGVQFQIGGSKRPESRYRGRVPNHDQRSPCAPVTEGPPLVTSFKPKKDFAADAASASPQYTRNKNGRMPVVYVLRGEPS